METVFCERVSERLQFVKKLRGCYIRAVRFVPLFAAGVDFVLRSSCHVDAGSVVKVSEEYAASVFRVEVWWVV
jgi:hypothetical protein